MNLNNNNNRKMKEAEPIKIIVPPGIRFMSDWSDYEDTYMYPFPHILDKQMPGCGYTEFCIRNNKNVILCSPRKVLLQNKTDQHQGRVYYARNVLDQELQTDKDLEESDQVKRARSIRQYWNFPNKEKLRKEEEELKKKRKEEYERINQELRAYCNICDTNGEAAKILVTYDSFWLIKDILQKVGIFKNFYVVVDEFQSIFTDAFFKPGTENSFVKALRDVQSLVYVSATPMTSKYIKMVPEFVQLPIYKLDWGEADPSRITKPELEVKRVRSTGAAIKPVIQKYLAGDYPKELVFNQDAGAFVEVESTELVIYVNSVTNIIRLIKNNGIKPEDVNILCANTKENRTRIQVKLGKAYGIGRVPTKQDLANGGKHKKFTLCTRTVYLGADFYSTCAKSYILSDANISTLTLDISMDLPQILGRQRLDENHWKNKAVFYYTLPCNSTQEAVTEFIQDVKKKDKETGDLLIAHEDTRESVKDSHSGMYKRMAKEENYKYNYVAVDDVLDPNTGITKKEPKLNQLVKIADLRAIEIQKVDYADRFSVFNQVSKTLGLDSDKETGDILKFIEEFGKLDQQRDKLKLLCEFGLSDSQIETLLNNQLNGTAIATYYRNIGPEGLKKINYRVDVAKQNLLNQGKFVPSSLGEMIRNYFEVGKRYSSASIKNDLADFYSRCDYDKTAVANDIKKWLKVKPVQWRDKGKKVNGYEIVKKKDGDEDPDSQQDQDNP